MSSDRPSAFEQAFYWLCLASLVIGLGVFGLHHQERLSFGNDAAFDSAASSGTSASADPSHPLSVSQQVRALLGAGATSGDLSTDADRRQRAIELIDSMLEADPNSAEAHLLKGLWSLGAEDLAGARGSVERSLELAPDALRPLLALGTIHYQGQSLEEAEAVFRRVVELFPDEQAGYHNLGQVLWSQGREDEATEVYRQKLEVKRRQTGTGEAGASPTAVADEGATS